MSKASKIKFPYYIHTKSDMFVDEVCKIKSESEVYIIKIDRRGAESVTITKVNNYLPIVNSSHIKISKDNFKLYTNIARERINDMMSGMCKMYFFGETEDYHINDIVVWRGKSPCIGRIKGINIETGLYSINNSTHNELNTDHLRYATPDEIETLGNKDIYLFEL
jgi:hypothetical protein